MIAYITDNPEIKNQLKIDSFLAYQLYDWRYEEVPNKENPLLSDRILRRKIKNNAIIKSFRMNDEIVAFVSPSNYKLIYDLLFIKKEFSKKVKFVAWHDFKKRKSLKINKEYVTLNFDQYLQRGVLTKKEFNSLAFYNFIRIEQFVSMLLIVNYNTYHKTSYLLGLDDNYEEVCGDDEISILGIIRVLMHEKGFFYKAIDSLTYQSRKLNITDPFCGNFKFLNTSNSLYKLYEKYKDSDLYKGIDDEKKLKKHKAGVSIIIKYLNLFFPLVDVLKTLRYMETNSFIKSNGAGFDVFSPITPEEMNVYSPFYDISVWKDLYASGTYQFNSFFPKIQADVPLFVCPLCGTSELKTTPLNFFCENVKCHFKISRKIKPAGKPKILSERELLQLIHYGVTHIKNKMGGYSRYILKQHNLHFMAIPDFQKNYAEE